MRVIGSTTTLVIATAASLSLAPLAHHRELAALADLMDTRRDRVGGDSGGRAHRERRADGVGVALHAEASHIGQPAVERRHGVPEVALGAAEAGVAGTNRPAGARVPEKDRAGRIGRRPLAAHVIETPTLAGGFVVEPLHELPGVEIGALGALVV